MKEWLFASGHVARQHSDKDMRGSRVWVIEWFECMVDFYFYFFLTYGNLNNHRPYRNKIRFEQVVLVTLTQQQVCYEGSTDCECLHFHRFPSKVNNGWPFKPDKINNNNDDGWLYFISSPSLNIPTLSQQ
jgi:hypothetical protein